MSAATSSGATADAAVAELDFFSPAWAEAARVAVNAGPSDTVRAQKIDRYWDWIDLVKQGINVVWGLAASDRPAPNCVLLTVRAGVATTAELVSLEEGRQRATYLLAGPVASWRELMAGYDVGKTVMYRKLMMDTGDVLQFFRAAYFWTESLGCIQQVPTRF
jgi:hypothetical protein